MFGSPGSIADPCQIARNAALRAYRAFLIIDNSQKYLRELEGPGEICLEIRQKPFSDSCYRKPV
jgi:hypothetical protein